MARPRTPTIDRIMAKTVERDGHLLWTGQMRGRRPHLHPIGNPVRILLQVDSPHIQVRPTCFHPECIEPLHWRVIVETSDKYGVQLASWTDPRLKAQVQGDFTDTELRDIAETVEGLQAGDLTWEEVREFVHPKLIPEIERLCPPS